MQLQADREDGDEAGQVADNIIGGAVAEQGDGVQLEDGDSSSEAGFQAFDDGGDEVLSDRRRRAYGPVRNIVQRRVRARRVY